MRSGECHLHSATTRLRLVSMVSSQESETGAPKMCCDWRALGGTLRVIWGLDIFYRPWGYNGHMMSYSTFRSTIKDWNGAEDPILFVRKCVRWWWNVGDVENHNLGTIQSNLALENYGSNHLYPFMINHPVIIHL